MLVFIDEPVKYLARTGLVFMMPAETTTQHPTINAKTAADVNNHKEVENDQWKRDYAVVLGFIRRCGENIHTMLC